MPKTSTVLLVRGEVDSPVGHGRWRDVVASLDGELIDGMPDGERGASFRSAAAATDAAVELAQSLAAAGSVGLAVGDDTAGSPAVTVAGALARSAGRGRILAVDLVRVLAGSRTSHGFLPHGSIDQDDPDAPPIAVCLVEPAVPQAPDGAGEGGRRRVRLPPSLERPAGVPLVGRADESSILDEAWLRSGGGAYAVALVGEPGVGKTKLASDWARARAAEGTTVLHGTADEGVTAPLQLWIEALRHPVMSVATEQLAEWTEGFPADLAVLMPELTDRLDVAPAASTGDHEADRRTQLEALVEFVGRIAAGDRVVLVLDDIQWADEPSLYGLRLLLRRLADAPVLVVATMRPLTTPGSSALADLLVALTRERLGRTVAVECLDETTTARLIATWAGGATPDEFSAAVHAETGGNPLFTEELLAHLAESGAVRRDSSGTWISDKPISELGLPETVRDVVHRRLEPLGEPTVRLLTVASLLGSSFDPLLLGEIEGLELDTVLDRLDPARRSRLVVDLPEGDALAFSHAIVQATLADDLQLSERVGLHRRIGEAIEARRVANRQQGDAWAPALARHFGEAMLEVPAQAYAAASAAAERAERLFAFEAAARFHRMALDALDLLPPDRSRRCRHLVGLGGAYTAIHRMHDARRVLDEAASLAAANADIAALGTILDLVGRTPDLLDGDPLQMRVSSAIERLSGETPSPSRELVLARAYPAMLEYFSLVRSWSIASIEEAADAAVEMATDVGDPYALAVARHVSWVVFVGRDDPRRLWTIASAVLEALDATDDQNLLSEGRLMANLLLLAVGRTDEARARAVEADQLARDHDLPLLRYWASNTLLPLDMMAGRFGEVEATNQAIVDGLAEFETFAIIPIGRQADLHWWRGDLEACAAIHEMLLSVEVANLVDAVGLAVVRAQQGQTERARQLLAMCGSELERLPLDSVLHHGWACGAEAAARLGDETIAAAMYDRLAPLAGTLLVHSLGISVDGAADLFCALCALTLRRYDEAELHLRDALALEGRVGDAIALTARTEQWYGRLLLERDAPGDRSAAADRLQSSRDAAARLGMRAIASESAALLSSAT